ncbi:hypothetical protein QO014_003130 [Kaistia dalseonensis]|uniref:Uncharacterized protein n=1 Tax=Kaistia dalseonensis TaxID=410840 RepID=A0ABU0H8X3_9HYPH|nr:hypothetical protein [Kaistia dalseonensis]
MSDPAMTVQAFAAIATPSVIPGLTRDPFSGGLIAAEWIPAFAGMTAVVYRAPASLSTTAVH